MAAAEFGQDGLSRFGPDKGIVIGKISVDGGLQVDD
jgi:hypothetical protein